MVFLNLPETREERVRRDEREKTREEEKQKRIEEVEKARGEERAAFVAWRERMQDAQGKGEPFNEPLPWE